jgi:hypothetical protein
MNYYVAGFNSDLCCEPMVFVFFKITITIRGA